MFNAVIFDMDGVLVDSHPVHEQAWRRLLQSLGRTVSDRELEFVHDGRKRDEILRFFFGDLPDSALRQYGLRKDSFFAEYAEKMKLVRGAREFVSALSEAGVRLAIASSASRVRAERTLEQFDLRRYFAAVVTGNDVARGKPDPAVYRAACVRLNGAPGQMLVVEDAVSGIDGARAAGMRCIGVADGSRAHLLYEAGADVVIPDFEGLTVAAVSGMFAAAESGSGHLPASDLSLW
jgi:HAD superfamily hydrolase (TIGR01509 family)